MLLNGLSLNFFQGSIGVTGDRGAIFIFRLYIKYFAISFSDFEFDRLTLDMDGFKSAT